MLREQQEASLRMKNDDKVDDGVTEYDCITFWKQ